MRPASAPRPASSIRALVVDGERIDLGHVDDVVRLLEPGDVVVVNDAATLPASLRTTDRAVEVRLMSNLGDHLWLSVLLGEGDFRTRTEHRPPPPRLDVGARLVFSDDLFAIVEEVRPESPRLLAIRLSSARVWEALYRAGRPVQYAHVPEPLALWDVQNVYAGRPWAVEMPSAGRALRAETILRLRDRGVEVVALTHAAGLSSVGDPAIDAMLPMPERYEIPKATWDAVKSARRVVAIGTSVVRALETAARTGELAGTSDLSIGPRTPLLVVDAVLTGVHEADTSHYALLRAFAPESTLARVLDTAERRELYGHEFGDVLFVRRKAA